MFPFRALKQGGTFALFATEAGKLDVVKINADRGRLFHCKYGFFQLNKKYRYQLGKSDIYFYDQKGFNPLDVSALVNIRNYLQLKKVDSDNEMKNAPILTEYEISLITSKFQDYLTSTQGVVRDPNTREVLGLSADAVTLQNILMGKLEDNTRTFLDDYFEEDEIAQTNMLSRIPIDMKFRIKESRVAHELIPQKRTWGKKNVALVVINNRLLDLVPVDAMQDEETGLMIIKDRFAQYGTFVVEETKTRYRHGKTNIFIVAVKTIRRPKDVPVEQEKPQEMVATLTTPGGTILEPDKPVTTRELVEILQLAMETRDNKNNKKKKKEDKAKKDDGKENKDKDKDEKKGKKKKIEIDPLTGNPKEGAGSVSFVPIKGDKDQYAKTISINATTFLPKVDYVDPLLAETRVKTTQHQKVVTDLLGGPIGKKIPINPILVLLLIMGTAIGSVIIWQQIVEPSLIKAEQKRFNELQNEGGPPVTGTPGADGSEVFGLFKNPFSPNFLLPEVLHWQ